MQPMNLTDFWKAGYVQEVNRLLLHPLGMALYVSVVDETQQVTEMGIHYTDDPEGIIFAELDTSNVERGQRIDEERERRVHARMKALGYFVQPLEVTK